MSTQPNTTDLDRQRAEFEAWAKDNGYRTERRDDPASPDYYFRHETEQRWIVWQAAALARRSQPVAATKQAAGERQEPVAWACPLDERGNALSEPDVDWGKDCIWAAEFKPFPLYAAPVAQQPEAGDKPFAGPGAWFSIDILGNPMREYKPGKWENAIWPSASQPTEAGAPTAAAEPTMAMLAAMVGHAADRGIRMRDVDARALYVAARKAASTSGRKG